MHLALNGLHSIEYCDYPRVRIEESFRKDVNKVHQLVEHPEEADVILFATNHHNPLIGPGLWNEEVYKRFPEKTVLYNCHDYPSPLTGGLCPSWEERLDVPPGLGLGWCYFHPTSAEPTLSEMKWENTPKYLWSFKGSINTHVIRDKLFELNDPKAYVEDTSKTSLVNLRKKEAETDEDKKKFLGDYAKLLRRSAFVVCPRGIGASSMRIFEAMRVGRAPVIVSDAWVPPPFIDWEKCSIRIQEAQINSLPDVLRTCYPEAERLGKNARLEWERVFGEEHLFHYTVEACLLLLQARSSASKMRYASRYLSVLKKPYLRTFLRDFKNNSKRIFSGK